MTGYWAARATDYTRDTILGKLMRRYAGEGAERGLDACAELLAATPAAFRPMMHASLDQGLQDRPGTDRVGRHRDGTTDFRGGKTGGEF